MTLITQPGFYPQITCEQYFAEPCPAPALTNSGIRALLSSCPAKFAHQHPAIGQPEEERAATAALRMGNLVHRLALGKGSDYAISPHDAYRSNEAKEWKAAAENAGLVPVKQAEFEQAEAMAEVIRHAIEVETQGEPYETEVVVAWRYPVGGLSLWCRAMLDVWCPSLDLALDVKTCADASDTAITRAFANGYAGQAAWYLDGISALHDSVRLPRFGFLFVEKDAPFLARFAEPSPGFMDGARMASERAAAIFATCLKSGEWPGYQPFTAQPPSWWLAQITDLELEDIAA